MYVDHASTRWGLSKINAPEINTLTQSCSLHVSTFVYMYLKEPQILKIGMNQPAVVANLFKIKYNFKLYDAENLS